MLCCSFPENRMIVSCLTYPRVLSTLYFLVRLRPPLTLGNMVGGSCAWDYWENSSRAASQMSAEPVALTGCHESEGDTDRVIPPIWPAVKPARVPNASPTLPFSAAQRWSTRKAVARHCPKGLLYSKDKQAWNFPHSPGASESLWSTRF